MATLTDTITEERPDILGARRLVVKVGSTLLVDSLKGLRQNWLFDLAEDVAKARLHGIDVVLVSSGSIALGRVVLNLPRDRPLTLEQAQAAAAVGQIHLAHAYQESLAKHNIATAQILVTLEDTKDRRRYLNTRATLETLMFLGTIPIVNENDTVATDEIRFGDNDRLAAQIAVTIGADQLILLSDVDGFYSANPKTNPNAHRLNLIREITPEIETMAGEPISGISKGGMKTKLMAARTAMSGGCAMAIMQGNQHHPLCALSTRKAASTWFLPADNPQLARKRWINALKTKGRLFLDAGAVSALHSGKSLLPVGVTRVEGNFGRGDPVDIVDPNEVRLGHGLVHYSDAEITAIAGHRTGDVPAILGYQGRIALIHRDDMILL